MHDPYHGYISIFDIVYLTYALIQTSCHCHLYKLLFIIFLVVALENVKMFAEFNLVVWLHCFLEK